MKAVGKFYDDNANIVRHGEKHATIILKLPFLFRLKFDAGKFRHAANEHSHLFAEHVLNVLDCVARILNNIMQKRGGNRRIVDVHFRQNICHVQRVNNVRFSRFTRLSGVSAFG